MLICPPYVRTCAIVQSLYVISGFLQLMQYYNAVLQSLCSWPLIPPQPLYSPASISFPESCLSFRTPVVLSWSTEPTSMQASQEDRAGCHRLSLLALRAEAVVGGIPLTVLPILTRRIASTGTQ